MEFIKKYWGYFATFLMGVLALFFATRTNNSGTGQNPITALKEEKKEEIKQIDEKLEDLKENGVKDMSDQEVVDYWKKN
jgi:predicted peroxiredoxin